MEVCDRVFVFVLMQHAALPGYTQSSSFSSLVGVQGAGIVHCAPVIWDGG